MALLNLNSNLNLNCNQTCRESERERKRERMSIFLVFLFSFLKTRIDFFSEKSESRNRKKTNCSVPVPHQGFHLKGAQPTQIRERVAGCVARVTRAST